MADPPSWPPGVTPVKSLTDLARFGIGPRNRLFWDGKPVEVRRTLDLSRAQKIGAIIIAIGAVLGGLGGFITGVQDGANFLCARHVTWLGCPPGQK